jgi:hypothetical protein
LRLVFLIESNQYGRAYRETMVLIPRCEACRKKHLSWELMERWGTLGPDDKPEAFKREFPIVKKLISEGWEIL